MKKTLRAKSKIAQLLKSSLTAAVFSVSFSLPQESHAFLIISKMMGTNLTFDGYSYGHEQTLVLRDQTFWCIALIVTIPFCLLNEQGQSGSLPLDSNILKDNGFSSLEISRIQKDYVIVNRNLQTRKSSIHLSEDPRMNGRANLEKVLKEVHSQVSQEFISWAEQMLQRGQGSLKAGQ